jgi:gas vesicle protein
MTNNDLEDGFDAKYLWGFLGGLLAGTLVGALAGAGAMLLLAPQSGKRTRARILRKGAELSEQATDTVEGSLAYAGNKAGQIMHDVRETADGLEHRAQAVFDEQSERASSAVKAGKKAVRDLQD